MPINWLLNLASIDAKAPDKIVIFPPGRVEVTGEDDVYCTAEAASDIIQHFRDRGVKIPVDYEHSSVRKAGIGEAAPAAGWITDLQFDPAIGLVGNVEWTSTAAEQIKAGQYKYLSPAFLIDNETRAVTKLHSVAVTNNPRIKRMRELIAASMSFSENDDMANPKTANMEALKSLMAKNGMCSETATHDEIATYLVEYIQTNMGVGSQLCSLAETLGLDKKSDVKVITASVTKLITERVPATEFQAMKTRLEALEAEKKSSAGKDLVEASIKAGKINPNDAQLLKWANDYAVKDADGFKVWSESAPKQWEPGETKGANDKSTTNDDRSRKGLIASAKREFLADEVGCSKLGFNLASWIDGTLVLGGQAKLSKEELAAIVA